MMLTRRSVTLGSAAVATGALVLGPRTMAQAAENGQAVLDWQKISFRTTYADQTPVTPIPIGVPVLAFVSLAMHKAARRSAQLGMSSESAAVARAAHDVLVHYFPGTAEKLAGELATTFQAIGAGPARAKGSRVGADAARDVLESRRGDGWFDTSIHYAKDPGAGVWQPSGTNTDMLAAWLGSLRHVLVVPHPVSGPYRLTSPAWAADYNEVKALGSNVQGERTDWESATATFHNLTHSGIAMGNAMVEHLAANPRGIKATARIFAAMHIAAADALIYTWQQKRDVGFWRPFQAISGVWDDENGATEPQSDWAPMIGNPNYSDYLSGHGCLTGPQVEVVRRLLGEATPLTLRTPASVGTSRTYETLSEIEHEALHARIWGGLHYRKAMVDTYEMAHSTAVRVLAKLA